MAKKSKILEVIKPTSTPEWGANAAYAFCDVFGGDAVLYSGRQQGWMVSDRAPKSQHPHKVNPGVTVRYFGSE